MPSPTAEPRTLEEDVGVGGGGVHHASSLICTKNGMAQRPFIICGMAFLAVIHNAVTEEKGGGVGRVMTDLIDKNVPERTTSSGPGYVKDWEKLLHRFNAPSILRSSSVRSTTFSRSASPSGRHKLKGSYRRKWHVPFYYVSQDRYSCVLPS
jgi:hypothetical protein